MLLSTQAPGLVIREAEMSGRSPVPSLLTRNLFSRLVLLISASVLIQGLKQANPIEKLYLFQIIWQCGNYF